MPRFELLDPTGNVIGTGDTDEDAHAGWTGSLVQNKLPEALMKLLRQLEDLVNGQHFPAADLIWEEIDDFKLRVTVKDGETFPIEFLFLNESGGISFSRSKQD